MALLAVLAFGMACLALSRTAVARDLARRVSDLEREIRELRTTLHQNSFEDAPKEVEEVSPAFPESPMIPPASVDLEATPQAGKAALDPASVVAEPRRTKPRWVSSLPPTPSEPPADSGGGGSAGGRLVDWERWLGVQGAAVLGGGVLALAGLLFFRYSIEHQLISPMVRVILGTLIGLGCVAFPRLPLARDYSWAANAVTGAGVVVLYAAFWAAGVLYELIPVSVAFGLMILVTSTGCLLALRERSQLIAILGLVGGFATPFLLSSGADRPLGLFGYLLLLDMALLTLARRRGWPWLALLSLVATILYQVAWIGLRMGPDRLLFGTAVLAVFAGLYALGARPSNESSRPQWLATQVAGLLLPFAVVFYLTGGGVAFPDLWPLAGLMILLGVFSGIIARRETIEWLPIATASGTVGAVTLWALNDAQSGANALELQLSTAALAIVYHGFLESNRKAVVGSWESRASLVATGGLFTITLLVGVTSGTATFWGWLATWLLFGGLLVRHGDLVVREAVEREEMPSLPLARLGIVGWGGVAVGMALLLTGKAHLSGFPSFTTWVTTALVLGVMFQGIALLHRKRSLEEAAGAFSGLIAMYLATVPQWLPVGPSVFLSAGLAFGFLVTLVATRLGSGGWYLAALVLAAVTHFGWSDGLAAGGQDPEILGVALALESFGVLLFTAWPFLFVERFRSERFAWVGAALAGSIWFLPLRQAFVVCFGDAVIGILPVMLAAVSVVALARVRSIWRAEDPERNRLLAWFAAVALGFVSITFPLQLDKEWVTIGWALEGAAVIFLWRRLEQTGLKYFALVLLGAVAARLVFNEAVLTYYPRSGWPIVNWILYTYWVPATALVVAAWRLAPLEVSRARDWERRTVYKNGWAVGAGLCGIAAVLVVFVWINLAIADWYSTGTTLRISFGEAPARDLTTSIAWAVYALVLLSIGVAWHLSALRWVSLAFLTITIFKVFLHDLGELEDLFRVLSLLGLAVSLILVSLGYQRFVFRRPTEKK